MINNLNLKIRVLNIIVGILLFNIQLFAADPGAPTGLIIEIANNEIDVIVVDDAHPEFGWVMNDTDKNEYQTAYQILVASSKEKLMNNILAGTDKLTNTIKLGTHYAMMLNSRDDINQIINNIAKQPELDDWVVLVKLKET